MVSPQQQAHMMNNSGNPMMSPYGPYGGPPQGHSLPVMTAQAETGVISGISPQHHNPELQELQMNQGNHMVGEQQVYMMPANQIMDHYDVQQQQQQSYQQPVCEYMWDQQEQQYSPEQQGNHMACPQSQAYMVNNSANLMMDTYGMNYYDGSPQEQQRQMNMTPVSDSIWSQQQINREHNENHDLGPSGYDSTIDAPSETDHWEFPEFPDNWLDHDTSLLEL
uniref:GATA zinc finger domain-containing protein 10-like n=1 Tax=Steinernema glaseri TaxID=37863 RepID=A0A1I7YW92_9BILA